MDSIEFIINDTYKMMMDWPFGTILSILICLVSLIIIFLIMWGLFTIIDSWFLPRQDGIGIIMDKNFTPAHNTTHLMNVGNNVIIPTTTHYPDDYSLVIEIDGKNDSISVNKKFFKSVSKDSQVRIEFVLGRISNGLYIKEIGSV